MTDTSTIVAFPPREQVNARKARNLLELAALSPSRDRAASLICVCLKINERTTLAKTLLSDPDVWKSMTPEQRLLEIGDWVRAECFELFRED